MVSETIGIKIGGISVEEAEIIKKLTNTVKEIVQSNSSETVKGLALELLKNNLNFSVEQCSISNVSVNMSSPATLPPSDVASLDYQDEYDH